MTENQGQVVRGSALADLLLAAAHQRALVQVRPRGRDDVDPGISRVLRTDVPKRQLVIHQLGDPQREAWLTPGSSVDLVVIVGSQPYGFSSLVQSVSQAPRGYVLDLPSAVEITQRRAFVRIEPPSERSVDVRLQYAGESAPHAVRLLNLSVGGILLLDPERSTQPVEDEMLQVHLRFDDGQSFDFEAAVRHSRSPGEDETGLCVGVAFKVVPSSDAAMLSQIVLRWQSEKGQ